MAIALRRRRNQIPSRKRERGGVSELHGLSYRSDDAVPSTHILIALRPGNIGERN